MSKWFRTDNYTGTLDIQKFKIEIGSQPTDWSIAYEDLDTSYVLEYTTTLTKDEPTISTTWSDSLGVFPNNVYVWQRTVTKDTHNNTIAIGAPVCIFIPSQILEKTEMQYRIHTSKETAPTDIIDNSRDTLSNFPSASSTYANQIWKALDTNIDYICQLTSSVYSWQEYSSWSLTKPVWTEEETGFLWTRIKYTYVNPKQVSYSIPVYDNAWENYSTLSKSISDIDDAINRDTKGTVTIKDGCITVFNNVNPDNATAKVIINTAGIGFVNKSNGEWGEAKTVWGYNPSKEKWEFNAEGINVIHLSADEIEDGILTLKGTDITLLGSYRTLAALVATTGTAGAAYYVEEKSCPYVWDTTSYTWVAHPGGEFLLADKDKSPICAMDVNGWISYAKDGSKVKIQTIQEVGATTGMLGLQLYDSNDNLIAWTNTVNGTWNVKNQVIEESIVFGTKVKMVVLDVGIGFVATT